MRRLAPIEPLRRRIKPQNDLSTSPDESFDAANYSGPKNLRATHACESCRFLKVRCLSHINPSIQKCQRCARLNQECLVKPRAPRKARRRTDLRVEELEQKVEALKAAFSMSSGSNRSVWSAADSNEEVSLASNQEYAAVLEKGASVNMSPTSSEADFQIPLSPCAIARGIFPRHNLPTPESLSLGVLNPAIATKLFNKFQSDILEHFPLDLFPEGEDASVVRERSPSLFLTIIAAAAGDYDLELHTILNDQLAEDFAKRIIFDGEKSVELVQALICAAAFYHPPDAYEKHKYYQYIQMAWNMATDLGLGRSGGPALLSKPHRSPSRNSKDELERNLSCRTLLASYMSCLSVSRISRREIVIHSDDVAEQCIEALQKSTYVTPRDRQLIAWVELEIIMKDATQLLGLSETDSPANVADIRTQCTIKAFEDRLERWKKELSPGVMHPSLEITYHYSKIYLHEIAFHYGDNMEDFRPPFRLNSPSKVAYSLPDLQTARLDCVITSMTSAHSLINVLLQLSPQALCVIPTVMYIRASYAIFILLRIFFISSAPGSGLGCVLDPASVETAYYLNRIVSHMQTAAIGGNCRLAIRFCNIFSRSRDWFRKHALRTDWESGGVDEDVLEPFRLLSLNDEPDCRPCLVEVETPDLRQRAATRIHSLPLDTVDSAEKACTNRNLGPTAAESGQLDRGNLASRTDTWQYPTPWGSQKVTLDAVQAESGTSEAQLAFLSVNDFMQIPLGEADNLMDDPFDLDLGFDFDSHFWDFDMGNTTFESA